MTGPVRKMPLQPVLKQLIQFQWQAKHDPACPFRICLCCGSQNALNFMIVDERDNRPQDDARWYAGSGQLTDDFQACRRRCSARFHLALQGIVQGG